MYILILLLRVKLTDSVVPNHAGYGYGLPPTLLALTLPILHIAFAVLSQEYCQKENIFVSMIFAVRIFLFYCVRRHGEY